MHITRYHTSRYFALLDGQTLLAVTVYRKGAEALKARLEADAQAMADLQRRLAERPALTPHFRERVTETGATPEPHPLLAAEETPVYRQPVRHKPAPRR